MLANVHVKDLPISTLLPIMFETSEITSDIEEMGEQFDQVNISPDNRTYSSDLAQATHTPPVERRGQTSSSKYSASGTRRSSLPCDQSTGVIRRHFNQLKTRRKVSAPTSSQQAPNSNAKIAPTSPNPLAAMTGSPLIDLLEKLRPRHSSTDSGVESTTPASINYRTRTQRRGSVDTAAISSGTRRTVSTLDDGFHSDTADDAILKPLFVDTRLANCNSYNCPATVPRQCLYYRQTTSVGVGLSDFKYQRQRSNSEAGRYLLVRRCGDINGGSEFFGKIEAEWAYCQILASMKCYDLMPQLSKMVVVDANLSIRKAFHALVQNDIRAAPIWDGQRQLFMGLLTVTDLIRMLIDHAADTRNTSADHRSPMKLSLPKIFDDLLDLPLNKRPPQRRDSPIHSSSSNSINQNHQRACNHLIYALADENVSKAAKLLCDRRLHRLVIFDPDKGGNPLFLLSKKDILKALEKYIARLPLPSCMEKTLDDLAIGTWSDLITVTSKTTLHTALSLLLDTKLSALPVIGEDSRLMDMLTKVDILNLVVENKGPVENILKRTVKDALKSRHGAFEKMATCFKKTTLSLAVECMLYSDVHRLAIVDTDGKLEGILALADLMKFLLGGLVSDRE